ncbi:MAG: sulfatase-like hydrolase/transferase [Vicinamibacterales bacterium]
MRATATTMALLVLAACGGGSSSSPAAQAPWILLVTLDTTRADVMTPDVAPVFTRLAAEGRRFTRAHATVPETLPSHTSMLTGLYPGGHGIHENGRAVSDTQPLLASELKSAGYQTAAVVSSYVLARRFGLARGFDGYDDGLAAGANEQTAGETSRKAREAIARLGASGPAFLWVHFFDAHAPYAPPEPYRGKFATEPYRGEVAYADAESGAVIDAFRAAARAAGRDAAVIIASDHGEGLGEHGEAFHGHLVYQPTMHVPLVVVGPGVSPGVEDTAVSLRRVYHTVLDWAGRPSPDSLRAPAVSREVVLGEAMKPFLQYGWQPQIMAVDGSTKAILAGRTEVFDLDADPRELSDLRTAATLPAPIRTALDDYPVPALGGPAAGTPVDAAAREKLASLGYVSASSTPVVRRDAPRPADMTGLFPLLDEASNLFVAARYREVVPVLQKILTADPNHLDATLRLATAQSHLGNDSAAMAAFQRASTLAPDSWDVKLYFALHLSRTPRWKEAVPALEAVLAREPDRVAALEGLALLRMQSQDTLGAITLFERARTLQPATFAYHLELGVLYLAARRLNEAARALDLVKAGSPDYPMALFKRAQVSVLLKEPDSAARIAAARRHADQVTRPLIEAERIFR